MRSEEVRGVRRSPATPRPEREEEPAAQRAEGWRSSSISPQSRTNRIAAVALCAPNPQLTEEEIAQARQRKTNSHQNSSLAPGPVDLDSRDGRRMLKAALHVVSPMAEARNAPNAQFMIRGAEVDQLGMTHVRLVQTFIGPTAFENEVIVHIRNDGSAFVTYGTERLEGAAPISGWVAPKALPHRQAAATAATPTVLKSLYSGDVQVMVSVQADGTTRLRDTTRGAGIATRDATQHPWLQKIERLDLASASFVSRRLHRHDDVQLDSRGQALHQEAIDAHYGATTTYDFLRDVFGRNSIDGRGERLIVAVGARAESPAWNGRNAFVGRTKQEPPQADVDVIGHELGHGLVSRTAALQGTGEPAAINEGLGDIIGTGVEWYASLHKPGGSFNYSIGEASQAHLGYPIRNLAIPGEELVTEHLSLYQSTTSPHTGSGIISHAFYLVAEGGENRTAAWLRDPDARVPQGIGIEKALKIFGRALMFYMTPTTTFAEARLATQYAAQDVFGRNSLEEQVVTQGWAAVGVKEAR